MKRILGVALVGVLVASAARAEEWEPAKTHAVLVGVLEWKNGLGGFSKKNRKDQELRNLLVQRGVPAGNISLLLDKDATLPKIREALAQTCKRCPVGSTLIVYYAGHGMPNGAGDFAFANYEIMPGKRETAWSLKDLGETLATGFKGKQVILWADCCFSGGLEIVVERLAKAKIAAVNLTSASSANTSTSNWTFTQSIIDGLRGEALIDANGDGKIVLAELAQEVRDAMVHLEGQRHGFTAKGVSVDLVLAKGNASKAGGAAGDFKLGTYVQASDKGRPREGRIVGFEKDEAIVQFYDYCDKRTVKQPIASLTKSERSWDDLKVGGAVVAGVKPDVEVEWNGTWYPAKVLKTENGKYQITYIGYGKEWDEWVGKDRIKFNNVKPEAAAADCEVEWNGTWFAAKVLKTENGKYFITYIGYGKEWDEWVGKDRIRMKKNTDKK